MESAVSSDDSCDSEMKIMKNQLTEFGFADENLSKEEMSDILKALNDSKSTEKEDEQIRQKADDIKASSMIKKTMKRRYINVRDRRMPWSVLPATLSQAEKARVLAVYIKLMSLNSYRQARQSSCFASWPPPLQVVEESTRVQPLRSTRSGRSVPIYADFDDDSSDLDFIKIKTKKRKVSGSDHQDGVYSNKTVSLKRKTSKEEINRPIKEAKLGSEKAEVSNVKGNKINIITIIED